MGEWTQIRAAGKLSELDEISAVMCMIDSGIMIEDYSDITTDGMYGALIDESILNADKNKVAVSVYIPDDRNPAEVVMRLRDRFSELGLDVSVETVGLREQDWENAWRQYYEPIHIGKIVIVPMWQDYLAKDGELIVKMDPGLAFGTGTHETTRLVIEMLQDYINGGERMLDLGCGSGILAICAAELGAKYCAAYDIDPIAVRVSKENIAASNHPDIVCGVSDLLGSVDKNGGKFDVIVANIVADIVLRLIPDVKGYLNDNGVFVVSGIICERADDITASLEANGYKIIAKLEDNGWCAIACKFA
jgi:ribosomal protein L11 methyltransferase